MYAVSYSHDKTCWSGAPLRLDSDCQRWLGRTVGALSYRITQHLGSGGMGHVFLAESQLTGERVAVKVLSEQADADQRQLFAEETAILFTQNHPNIVRAIEAGELDGTPYLAMEYLAGPSLAQWLVCDQLRSPSRVLYILAQVGSALEHLHAQGILHRDIKPANIMIDERDDTVKLIDFGIAMHESSSRCASHRQLVGTPAYMAPEQVVGGCCTRLSDVYALGALALELLTGRPPYGHVPVVTTLDGLLHGSPALPSARGLVVPGLDAFFERALYRDPAVRFQSARALINALAEVLQTVRSQSPSAQPARARESCAPSRTTCRTCRSVHVGRSERHA